MSDTQDKIVFERDGKRHEARIGKPAELVENALIVNDGEQDYSIAIDMAGGGFVARPIPTLDVLEEAWVHLKPYQRQELIETARAMLAPVPQSLRA